MEGFGDGIWGLRFYGFDCVVVLSTRSVESLITRRR